MVARYIALQPEAVISAPSEMILSISPRTVCHALIINKIDVLPYFDFDMEKVVEYAHMRNPDLAIFPVSAKTGEGFEAWENWLRKQTAAWNK